MRGKPALITHMRPTKLCTFGYVRTAKARLDCADAQSNLGLFCQQTDQRVRRHFFRYEYTRSILLQKYIQQFNNLSIVIPAKKRWDIVIPPSVGPSVRPSVRPAVCNVTPLLLDHLSENLETFTGDSSMDVDRRNTVGISM